MLPNVCDNFSDEWMVLLEVATDTKLAHGVEATGTHEDLEVANQEAFADRDF